MIVCLFDTETTDLIRSRARPLKDQPHVTEFFGMKCDPFMTSAVGDEMPVCEMRELSSCHSLFNPTVPLPAVVQKITGLNDDMLRNEPLFASDKGKEIIRYIEESDEVVAHNLSFDMAMMDIEAARLGIKINWPKRKTCTVEVTEHLKGRRMKLIELYEHLFGEPFEGAHRAECDVRPMARCYGKLKEMNIV